MFHQVNPLPLAGPLEIVPRESTLSVVSNWQLVLAHERTLRLSVALTRSPAENAKAQSVKARAVTAKQRKKAAKSFEKIGQNSISRTAPRKVCNIALPPKSHASGRDNTSASTGRRKLSS